MKNVTFILIITVALAGALLLANMPTQQSRSADVLLGAALHQEEVEGNLEAAIETYKKILAEYPDNRPLAAKALLQMGQCYEKLGKTEARKAYQRVIDNYSDQQSEVALAREAIARLSKALVEVAAKPRFTKIRIPTKLSTLGGGALSPAGGKFAFASEGSIWVVPVHGKVDPDIAGEPVRLTKPMEGIVATPVWSADGEWIAFNHFQDAGEKGIYVLRTTGGDATRVPVNTYRGPNAIFHRNSLSPDGKMLAFCSTEERDKFETNRLRIYTVPVEGGDPRKLTDAWTGDPAFSPNGQKIAFVKFNSSKAYQYTSELWVMPVQDGKPVLITDVPNRVFNPLWSPDATMIAFLAYPRESKAEVADEAEVWVVRLSDEGKPLNAPAKFPLPDREWVLLVGWTADNKIGMVSPSAVHNAIYTVPSGGGKATQVTPAGYAFHPRWTPDGERIAFRWGAGDLAYVPAGGGAVSLIPKRSEGNLIEATPGGGNAISPDGKKIVFSGVKRKERLEGVHIWTIPVEGGEPTQLTTTPTDSRFPCWSPDGKSIAFIRGEKNEANVFVSNIYTIPAEGGEVRQLTSASDGVAWSTIAWSPDGRLLAYFSSDMTIKVIPAAGGQPRNVAKAGPTDSQAELAWSPDSNRLVYSSQGSMHIASLDGGMPTELQTGLDAKAFHLAWSPDGGRIAFSAYKGGEPELWLMEDFLPLLKASK
jgi:Tol biopolymer transport system component